MSEAVRIKDLLYKQCPTCKGKGYTVERVTLCVTCLGTGAIKRND